MMLLDAGQWFGVQIHEAHLESVGNAGAGITHDWQSGLLTFIPGTKQSASYPIR